MCCVSWYTVWFPHLVSVRVKKSAALSICAVALIWTQFSMSLFEELIQGRTMPPTRVIWWHEFVVDKWVHQKTLFNDFLPLMILCHQIAEVVIWNNNTIVVSSMLDDVAVIITFDDFPIGSCSAWGPHKNAVLFKPFQNLLIGNWRVRAWCIFTPHRDKNFYVEVISCKKPVHHKANSPTGEYFLIPMTMRTIKIKSLSGIKFNWGYWWFKTSFSSYLE